MTWNHSTEDVYETPNSQHPKFFVKGAKVKREGATFTVVGFKMSCGMYDHLFIPDVHQKVERLKAILSRFPAKQVWFTGDYFDANVGHENDGPREMAKWLKVNLHNPNYHFCLGNHDIAYRIGWKILGSGYDCSDSSKSVYQDVNHVLNLSDWNKIMWHHWCGNHLLCHAGLVPDWFEGKVSKRRINNRIKTENAKIALNGRPPILFQVGWIRGGFGSYGGILWNDWSAYAELPDVHQIIGHTRHLEPQIKPGCLCLDTGLKHVAVGFNDKGKVSLEIKEVA